MNFIRKNLRPIISLALIVVAAILVKTFVLEIVRVDGNSMYPNLENNERVLLLKQAKLKRNRVIVFDAYGVDPQVTDKSTKYVKRIIALPGDRVKYTKSGQLYINGKLQAQDYLIAEQQQQGTLNLQEGVSATVPFKLGSRQSFTVPKGQYLVLGDNRGISRDSRYYGFVPKDKIDGVVKTFFWNQNGWINQY